MPKKWGGGVIILDPWKTGMVFLTCYFICHRTCILIITLNMCVHNIPYILILHNGYHYIAIIYVQISGLSYGTCTQKAHCYFADTRIWKVITQEPNYFENYKPRSRNKRVKFYFVKLITKRTYQTAPKMEITGQQQYGSHAVSKCGILFILHFRLFSFMQKQICCWQGSFKRHCTVINSDFNKTYKQCIL
jgi:hypothetical protein